MPRPSRRPSRLRALAIGAGSVLDLSGQATYRALHDATTTTSSSSKTATGKSAPKTPDQAPHARHLPSTRESAMPETYTKPLADLYVGEIVAGDAGGWWRITEVFERRADGFVDLEAVNAEDGLRGRIHGYGNDIRTLRR